MAKPTPSKRLLLPLLSPDGIYSLTCCYSTDTILLCSIIAWGAEHWKTKSCHVLHLGEKQKNYYSTLIPIALGWILRIPVNSFSLQYLKIVSLLCKSWNSSWILFWMEGTHDSCIALLLTLFNSRARQTYGALRTFGNSCLSIWSR